MACSYSRAGAGLRYTSATCRSWSFNENSAMDGPLQQSSSRSQAPLGNALPTKLRFALPRATFCETPIRARLGSDHEQALETRPPHGSASFPGLLLTAWLARRTGSVLAAPGAMVHQLGGSLSVEVAIRTFSLGRH